MLSIYGKLPDWLCMNGSEVETVGELKRLLKDIPDSVELGYDSDNFPNPPANYTKYSTVMVSIVNCTEAPQMIFETKWYVDPR